MTKEAQLIEKMLAALKLVTGADSDGETHDDEGFPTDQWADAISSAYLAIYAAEGY